jgi:hypothetical protein
LLILPGCSAIRNCKDNSSSTPPVVKPILDLKEEAPVLYQAKFSVFRYNFSGLIAFRRMSPEKEVRIAFISETGIKLMEFSYDGEVVSNTYCMPAISKKSRMRFVGQFLKLILHQPGCRRYCHTDNDQNSYYVCQAKGERVNLIFDDHSLKSMHLRKSRSQNAIAVFLPDDDTPATIEVNMPYRTKIHMKLIENAFK